MQGLEQGELDRSQLYTALAGTHPQTVLAECQPCRVDAFRGLDAAQHRLDPRHDLPWAIGLAHVIVGTQLDPEPTTKEDLASWCKGIQQEAQVTLERLGWRLAELPDTVRARAERLRRRRDDLIARIADLTPASLEAVTTRCHGDLHLGQVLVAGNDLVVIDFEGEPARPFAERRSKQCPLLDVAGLGGIPVDGVAAALDPSN